MTEKTDRKEDKKSHSKEQVSANTTIKSSTPSDALFKTIMEDVVAAREFLEYYLPDDFKKLIDLSTIKVEKESFVDSDLKRALSDIIYSLKTKEGEEAYAFVLIEQVRHEVAHLKSAIYLQLGCI